MNKAMNKKKLTLPAIVLAGALALMLAGCSGSGISKAEAKDDSAAVAEQTEPVKAEPVKEKPVKEPVAPKVVAPAAGTLANPHPIGYSASIYQGSKDNVLATVTVAVKDWNANAAIAQANMFNDVSQPGYHYVAIEYTFTGANPTEPASAYMLLTNWTLSQPDGVMIAESGNSVVLPDDWNEVYDLPDLYQGQIGSVVVIYQVPDTAGALLATAFGQYIAL